MQLGCWPSQCVALHRVWYSKHCHHPFLAGLFEIVWPRERLFRKASLLRAVHPPVWCPGAGGGCGRLSLAPRNLFHLQSTLQVFINHPLSPTRQQTGFISPTFTVVEARAERFRTCLRSEGRAPGFSESQLWAHTPLMCARLLSQPLYHRDLAARCLLPSVAHRGVECRAAGSRLVDLMVSSRKARDADSGSWR